MELTKLVGQKHSLKLRNSSTPSIGIFRFHKLDELAVSLGCFIADLRGAFDALEFCYLPENEQMSPEN